MFDAVMPVTVRAFLFTVNVAAVLVAELHAFVKTARYLLPLIARRTTRAKTANRLRRGNQRPTRSGAKHDDGSDGSLPETLRAARE